MSNPKFNLLDLLKRDLARQWAGIPRNDYDSEITRRLHTSVYDPPPMELYEGTHAFSAETTRSDNYEEQVQQEEPSTERQHVSQHYYADMAESEPMEHEDSSQMQQDPAFFDGLDMFFEDEYYGSLLEEMIEEEVQEEPMMDPAIASAEPAESITPEEQMMLLMLAMENMGG